MSRLLRRVRALAHRYRVDRRLPPPVRAVVVEWARLRAGEQIESAVARLLPVVGGPGLPARRGRRRFSTGGEIDRPVSTLAADAAEIVSGVLTGAGIRHFVTEQVADRVVLGLDLADRRRALDVLSTHDLGTGWFAEWTDRGRTGTVPLGRANHGRARVSRQLTVYRSVAIGGRATGPEFGVAMTFYTLGTSGELELVGTRGHERFDSRSPTSVETLEHRALPGLAAFPVANSLDRLHEPVDVVYTWVDGSDREWLDRFERTAHEHGRQLDETALDPARYRSRDELRYSLRSVWMYAGWIRHIFVVTAGQRPAWLADHPKVTVVDHEQILPPDALPTFNSHAIEASLHRIDGLAEHFIYFNDDMFLGGPTRPETFFTPNGLAKVFQSGARVPGYEDADTLAVDTAARRGRELLSSRFERTVTYKPLHSPYPLRRSVLDRVEREFPHDVASTRASRFRSPTDLSIAASFGQHAAIVWADAVFDDIDTDYVHVESGRLPLHLDRIRLSRRFSTFCVNETNDGHGLPERELLLRRFFEEMYPVAAPWER